MNSLDEFSIIDTFFRPLSQHCEDLIVGIGDDAACLRLPEGMELLVSCDSLLDGVHFLSTWDPYDIAYRAVMVTISDIAAMGGKPHWLMLALTLPAANADWLKRFANGLQSALRQYNIALIGGDTTRGPLSITMTAHGFSPIGKSLRRSGARVGDAIYVTGELGAAAQAIDSLNDATLDKAHRAALMDKLLRPTPRFDMSEYLQTIATSAIDISDGLSADLHHICIESGVGARLSYEHIPIHPLVQLYQGEQALDFAITGGDDYELCFTVSPDNEKRLLAHCAETNLPCYRIGHIIKEPGLHIKRPEGQYAVLSPKGYSHFV